MTCPLFSVRAGGTDLMVRLDEGLGLVGVSKPRMISRALVAKLRFAKSERQRSQMRLGVAERIDGTDWKDMLCPCRWCASSKEWFGGRPRRCLHGVERDKAQDTAADAYRMRWKLLGDRRLIASYSCDHWSGH